MQLELMLVYFTPPDGMLVHRRVNLPVSIYTPGWREALWEWSVLSKNTSNDYSQGSNPDCL